MANPAIIHFMKQVKNNDFEIIKLSLGRWREYKELRLRALKTDPQAFLSTYIKEAEYPNYNATKRKACTII